MHAVNLFFPPDDRHKAQVSMSHLSTNHLPHTTTSLPAPGDLVAVLHFILTEVGIKTSPELLHVFITSKGVRDKSSMLTWRRGKPSMCLKQWS